MQRRACYLAMAITMDGDREVLGLWWQEKEGARFRLAVLNDLHLRGVKDILIACVDGLTGFPEAISTIYRRPGSRPASCTMPTRRLCRSCGWEWRYRRSQLMLSA